MPEIQPDQVDAESLARKLQGLEAQLSTGERKLLARVLAAAPLVGITVGTGEATGASEVTGASALSQHPLAVIEDLVDLEAQCWDDISGQFHDSFTPGEAWETPLAISVKPPR